MSPARPKILLQSVDADGGQVGEQRGLKALLPAAVSIVLLVLLIGLEPVLGSLPLRQASLLALVAAAAALACVAFSTDRGLWSVPAILLVLIVIFHGGLLAFAALGGTPSLPSPADERWFYSAATPRAAYLVAVAVLAFAAAATLATLGRYRTTYSRQGAVEESLGSTGACLLAVGVTAWFGLTAYSAGFVIFTAPYRSFLDATSGLPLTYVYLAIGLGLTLTALQPRAGGGRIALGLFLLFALVALPLGLRGEVLFPVAGGAAALAYQRRMPRPVPVLIIVTLLLAAFSVIKDVRQVGLRDIGSSQAGLSPAAGLGELGYTVRVLVESVRWHEFGSEPYLRYTTYSAPLDRQFYSRVVGRSVTEAAADPRLLNVEVRRRVGNIGGSIIGEAHHNDGIRGIVVVMALIGGGLARVSSGRVSTTRLALVATLLVPVLNHVRNSFVPVPIGVLAGLMLVMLVIRARADTGAGST